MRILIFLLALTSAFFVSKSFSVELDLTSLVPPKTSGQMIYDCVLGGKYNLGTEASITACYENKKDEIKAIYPSEGSSSDGGTCETSLSVNSSGPAYVEIRITYQISKPYGDGNICGNHTLNQTLRAENPRETDLRQCPPDGNPDHIYEYRENPSNDEFMCAKEKSYCPEPTDNDPFVFGTGDQTEKCFKNPDGSQCKIQTDENGGYYMPVSYGSAEPVMCQRAPDKEVDKTSPPEETDPQPEPDELSALNKINENLDAMNKNQIEASDSNDERLDRLAEETQISNELLGEIRYNTAMIDFNTDYANSLLEGILEKPVGGGGGGSGTGEGDGEEEQPFTIQAKRKNNNKGLNKLFTEQDLQTVTEEITQKRQELKDYVQQIKSESGSLFEVTPSFGGGYEERIVNIKGADVDMGLGRLASFFQLIAAAVLLISTLTALYILLGP